MTTLGQAAVGVLLTGDARAKAAAALQVAADWRAGKLAVGWVPVPDRPARPAHPELRDPSHMPKRGKAGNLASRQALLHAVAHIELNAIDLAFDIVARFGATMPRAFVDDWVRIGGEEAEHFTLLADRLEVIGCHYGALPAHDGLWRSAIATAHDLLARLAVVPLVLEARGLDVTPEMIGRLQRAGDADSAAILQRIYADEIGHVAAGSKWFHFAAPNRIWCRKPHLNRPSQAISAGPLSHRSTTRRANRPVCPPASICRLNRRRRDASTDSSGPRLTKARQDQEG